MAKNIKNIAASVHQRLLDKAKKSTRPFNELLQYFAMERFIYRLSKSPHGDRFILKGALIFPAWGAPASRPTMDIDLLGRIDNSLELIVSVMKEACRMDVEPDGMTFIAETVTATRITEETEYEGVRVRVHGGLGNAKISLQIDIGFGDVIVPGPGRVTYPALLDFPAPQVNGYPMESTIAEKFQTMVKLGVLNSRMKDFYDIWMLSRIFDFSGEILAEAIKTTFDQRRTPLNAVPVLFRALVREDENKQVQWEGFIKKAKLNDAPKEFETVVDRLADFLIPPAAARADGESFEQEWKVPGPWR